IPDSDADSSTPSPSPSTSPAPPTSTTLRAPSRKRSVSPSPIPANHDEAAPRSAPVPTGGDGIGGPAVDPAKSGEEEPQSEEAKAEERRGKRIEAIKARNEELIGEVEAMEEKLEVERGKLKYALSSPLAELSGVPTSSCQLSPVLTESKKPRRCGDGEGAYQAAACV
ncbi:hypothetical protein V493_04759, partial [Pseudogymnoascus sp. VKM F-4281 (FW-2241)]